MTDRLFDPVGPRKRLQDPTDDKATAKAHALADIAAEAARREAPRSSSLKAIREGLDLRERQRELSDSVGQLSLTAFENGYCAAASVLRAHGHDQEAELLDATLAEWWRSQGVED